MDNGTLELTVYFPGQGRLVFLQTPNPQCLLKPVRHHHASHKTNVPCSQQLWKTQGVAACVADHVVYVVFSVLTHMKFILLKDSHEF